MYSAFRTRRPFLPKFYDYVKLYGRLFRPDLSLAKSTPEIGVLQCRVPPVLSACKHPSSPFSALTQRQGNCGLLSGCRPQVLAGTCSPTASGQPLTIYLRFAFHACHPYLTLSTPSTNPAGPCISCQHHKTHHCICTFFQLNICFYPYFFFFFLHTLIKIISVFFSPHPLSPPVADPSPHFLLLSVVVSSISWILSMYRLTSAKRKKHND